MNTRETGYDLIQKAERVFEEAEHNLIVKDWNLVMRRAQEAVELALKGALRFLGIDFPKVHDVGQLFTEPEIRSRLRLSHEEAADIAQSSAYLASHRAAAFYVEEDYTEAQAQDARARAVKILQLIRDRLS